MKRKAGLEYLRIIAMLLIIGDHFLLFTGLLEETKPFTVNFYLVWLLYTIGYLGTNCYVLISGYFGVNATVTWKKLRNLYGQVLFYSITICIVMMIINTGGMGLREFGKALLPFSSREYWFVTDYIALYILSPYINIMLKNLNRKQFKKLIVVSLLLFSFIDLLPGDGINAQKGYSLYWLICVYCIGGYIRLYGLEISHKKLFFYGLISVGGMYLTKIVGTLLAMKISLNLMGYSTVFYAHSSIFVLICSVALFMYMKDIRNNDSLFEKVALKISPLTFGVYLIHMNPYLAAFYWGKLRDIIDIQNTTVFMWFFIMTLVIYITCTSIEAVRRFTCCYIGKKLKIRRKDV